MKNNSGFSLVELSIVIVIIGLLVGAITGAQSLIRSSKLASVISDVQGFKSAINAFQRAYYVLPGDITNPWTLWFTNGLCNGGNGDRQLNSANSTGGGASCGTCSESSCAWHGLAKTSFIPGTYSGLGGTISGGSNAPASKVENGTYLPSYLTSASVGVAWLSKSANYIVFGASGTAPTLSATALTVNEAWTIDSKADDGIPNTGDIVGVGSEDSCVDTNPSPDAYVFATPGKVCGLAFIIN